MPQSYSGDVESIDHPEDPIPSTIMIDRRVVVSDQRSSSSDPAATSSYSALGTVRYLECQRNHAAAIGGYAVDGCREFMASGEDGVDALTCAACGCHRSFHRIELAYS